VNRDGIVPRYTERQMKTRYSRLPLVVAAAAALTSGGCMSAADVAAGDNAACRGTGAKQGTPVFAKCLDNRKEQRRIAQIEGERAMQRMQWNMQQSAMQQAMRPRF
jgi:hypothetical protein